MDNSAHYQQIIPRIIKSADLAEPAEGQCDCACDHPVLAKAKNGIVSVSSQYQLTDPLNIYAIADQYYVLVGRETNPVVLNEAALTIVNHFKTPHTLSAIPKEWSQMWDLDYSYEIIHELINLGFIIPCENMDNPIPEDHITLTAWLHITDRCNLRCAYCYLPHKKEDMSLETGKAAIQATIRSAKIHKYKQIKLKYAGGEPLLYFPLLLDLHRYAIQLAQEAELDLIGVILTNGTLLSEEIALDISKIGLRVMISIDGLEEYHDIQRSSASSKGSFSRVVQGLEMTLKYGITPDISITVSNRNIDGLPDLISWLIGYDLPFSLNFYRENVLSASSIDLQFDDEKIINGVLAGFKVIEEKLPRRGYLASIVDRANLASTHLRTCGVGQSYLVFDSRGQVNKCQMLLSARRPITSVEAEDPLHLIRIDQMGIQNISVENKEGCRDCEWRYWCTGGCSLSTFRATGRYDIKSPNCKIYKAIYPEAVRLEGLRLLKYNDDIRNSSS